MTTEIHTLRQILTHSGKIYAERPALSTFGEERRYNPFLSGKFG